MKIQIVKKQGTAALVEWAEAGEIKRGILPLSIAEKGFADEETLEAAIPYGIPWAALMDSERDWIIITPQQIEKALHSMGVWTLEDYYQKGEAVRGALLTLVGSVFEAAQRAAKAYRTRNVEANNG